MLLPNGTHGRCLSLIGGRRGLRRISSGSPCGCLRKLGPRCSCRFKIVTYNVNCGCIGRTSASDYRVPMLGISRCPLPTRRVEAVTSHYKCILMIRSNRPFIRRRMGTVLSSSCRMGKHLARALPHANRLAPSGINRTVK